MDITVLLLHPDDVGKVIWFGLFRPFWVQVEEAELEEVLDDDGDLEKRTTSVSVSFLDCGPT